jgi:hypothetical protein
LAENLDLNSMRLYEELMMFNKITINFNYGENKKPYHKITKLKFCARTDIKKKFKLNVIGNKNEINTFLRTILSCNESHLRQDIAITLSVVVWLSQSP